MDSVTLKNYVSYLLNQYFLVRVRFQIVQKHYVTKILQKEIFCQAQLLSYTRIFLEICFEEYNRLSANKKKLSAKNVFDDLVLDNCDYFV